MDLHELTSAFLQLGNAFTASDSFSKDQAIQKALTENLWFTEENIEKALDQWSVVLQPESLESWIASEEIREHNNPKTVGLVMAGNIPLVGLHDLLSVLISGHKAKVKLSSQDKALMQFAIDRLISASPELSERLEIVEQLKDCDAFIATGSNNTSRYFDYYFRNKPAIIRKNRNSLAILNGRETDEELHLLGQDIFDYFGLGCRNVTHLLLPNKEARVRFYDGIAEHAAVINHNKYANNYTYHKALFLMNRQEHLDNNFLLLKEDPGLYSPIGCLFYSYYSNAQDIHDYIRQNKDQIQVVVGHSDDSKGIPFGKSQEPGLMDYADDVNTIAFLKELI